MGILERDFQAKLIRELYELFPGCYVLKNDPNYIQGFPDLTILYNDKWAVLECKKSRREPFQPNQEHYLNTLGMMSFSMVIYPENKEEVLDALQYAFCFRRPTRISKR